MIENVIVTLICSKREYDMELPANVKIVHLRPLICEAMLQKGIVIPEGFSLSSNGSLLDDSDTLIELGIWDGSYISIV